MVNKRQKVSDVKIHSATNCRVSLWCALILVVAVLIGLQNAPVQANEFKAGLDTTVWHLDPSRLHCRLWQTVPQFGEATFENLAGEPLKFYLDSLRPFNRQGEATVKVVAPFWRPGIREQLMGSLATSPGKRPLQTDEAWANRMLDELKRGMSPAFLLNGWTDKQPVSIEVSAVDFEPAYEGYVNCLSTLFPASYQQLRYTTFNYRTNIYGLSASDKARLDLVAGYVELDPSVSRIVVHGHTDNQGRRGHNWELSRLRGQNVVDYLKRRGVPEDMITMHFWADTRPQVQNTNDANRARNRRTYIQMDRFEP